MPFFRWRGGAVLGLAAFLVLLAGPEPVCPQEEKKPETPPSGPTSPAKPVPPPAGKPVPPPAAKPAASRPVTDAGIFRDELQRAGAFKFYDNTEDILRTGHFELAFARYLFLKSHLRGQAFYRGLGAMVDHRLHFLSVQMGLGAGKASARAYHPARRIRKKPVCPPTAAVKPAATATTPEKKPPEPGAPAAPGSPTAPEPQTKAAAPGDQTPSSPPKEEPAPPQEEAKEESPKKEEPPPPPPTFWEKFKRKAMFWK